jgi:hypothetical protein
MHLKWNRIQPYGLMEMTLTIGSLRASSCMGIQTVHNISEHSMVAMTLRVIRYFSLVVRLAARIRR